MKATVEKDEIDPDEAERTLKDVYGAEDQMGGN